MVGTPERNGRAQLVCRSNGSARGVPHGGRGICAEPMRWGMQESVGYSRQPVRQVFALLYTQMLHRQAVGSENSQRAGSTRRDGSVSFVGAERIKHRMPRQEPFRQARPRSRESAD